MSKLLELRPLPVGAKIRVERKFWNRDTNQFDLKTFEYQVGTVLPDGTLDGGCGCCGDSLSVEDQIVVLP